MKYDAIVLGAGPGGYATTIRLGQFGKKVLLIEKDKIGGECLNYGCIPSKAFIELASALGYLNEIPGVNVNYQIDMHTWQQWKWHMINKLTSGVELLCKSYGAHIIRGYGVILDKNHVSVNDEIYETEHLVIATGSEPVRIKKFGTVYYNREILDIERIPSKLVIIGGGYIGIEIGTAFAKLGTHVTVIEMMSTILPGIDPELVRFVRKRLKTLKVQVLESTEVVDITTHDREYTIHTSSGTTFTADAVLVTVGRKPNTQGFGLETLNLEMDGVFIKTDKHKKTSISTVYAVGDVAGMPMLAHKAYYDAKIVAESITGRKIEHKYNAMPYVIYSDPEIAYTGIKSQFHTRFPLGANGRALGMNAATGAYTIYYDNAGKVTGAAIVAPHASELISEISVAIESKLHITDIASTIHPHPTISEGIKESAEMAFGYPLHFKIRRK